MTDSKNATFGVWMPRDELRALDDLAEASGMSRNSLIRCSVAGNVTLVDAEDLHQAIGQLRAMHRVYDSHLERFSELAQQALERAQGEDAEILGKIIEECGRLSELKRSMRTMETEASGILADMRDAVKKTGRTIS